MLHNLSKNDFKSTLITELMFFYMFKKQLEILLLELPIFRSNVGVKTKGTVCL